MRSRALRGSTLRGGERREKRRDREREQDEAKVRQTRQTDERFRPETRAEQLGFIYVGVLYSDPRVCP